MIRRRSILVLVLAAGLMIGGGCAALGLGASKEPVLTRHGFEQPLMGTVFRILCYAPDPATANRAADAAFARARALNRAMSDYDPQSELSMLSASSPHERGVRISDDLYAVLALSEKWSYRSDGAFDATVGPMVRQWRRARHTGELPDADDLIAARASVGFDKLRLDPADRSARLTAPGMRLDLGGIAKGYAADEMLKVMREHGCGSALIDAGGSIVVGDAPPDAPGWMVSLMPEPTAADGETVEPVYLTLTNAGVATSGDAFQHVEIAGRRFSHIVDPRTGIGLTNQVSASVVVTAGPMSASPGADADALATAMCVLGPDAGASLGRRSAANFILVERFDDGAIEIKSSLVP